MTAASVSSMRLLLILALIVASVGFGPAAAARAEQPPTHHHMSHGHHHGGTDDGQHDKGAPAAIHVCPGCALLGTPAVASGDAVVADLPRLPANARAPGSIDAHPIPPPPRLA